VAAAPAHDDWQSGVVIRDKSPDQDHVIGRKSGRTISIPVWFVLEGEKLYLLPVQGSNTQWYKNVLRNPQIALAQQCRHAARRS
jgi:hypothetical protein